MEQAVPGRYEGTDSVLAATLDALVMDGQADDETGDVDSLGHLARVGRFLLWTDSQGFRTAEACETEDAARAEFAAFDAEYAGAGALELDR